MSSMFGLFEPAHTVAIGWTGAGGGGGGGGFPGIFPGGGVSNSGWAGLNQMQNQPPCGPDDVAKGRCVMGPPLGLSGAKRRGWR